MDPLLTSLVWSFTILCAVIGFAGILLPILPGTTLILVGLLVHKLFLPGDLSWTMFAIIAGVWLLSVIIDFVGVIIGARLFGGGKWGMAGAGGGALIGMFFSLPMLLLGTILGAVAAEKLIAKKSSRASFLAGVGAAAGFVFSIIGRLACAVAMLVLFAWSVWQASA